jgi:hypothetical protein
VIEANILEGTVSLYDCLPGDEVYCGMDCQYHRSVAGYRAVSISGSYEKKGTNTVLMVINV